MSEKKSSPRDILLFLYFFSQFDFVVFSCNILKCTELVQGKETKRIEKEKVDLKAIQC
jgi:hypothetical protein